MNTLLLGCLLAGTTWAAQGVAVAPLDAATAPKDAELEVAVLAGLQDAEVGKPACSSAT